MYVYSYMYKLLSSVFSCQSVLVDLWACRCLCADVCADVCVRADVFACAEVCVLMCAVLCSLVLMCSGM